MPRTGLLLLACLAAGLPLPAAAASDRITEVVLYDCASDLGRREVTLFGNGTVRLREGLVGQEVMGLAELDPDEVAAILRRFAEEDLSEVRTLPAGIDGSWVEHCRLDLALPDTAARRYEFGRYDSLPLPLSRVLRVVEDLAAKVVTLQGAKELPEGYDPQPGDVLERTDGQRFEIYAFTADHRGLELWGVDQPLTLYVPLSEVRREFVFLVSRKAGGRGETPR